MLLITLSFILLLTVIAVAFLVRSRSSLQTSQSYTKEIVAREIGEIAIDKLAAEFQDEINTARSSTNQMLFPPRIGATTNNPRESALVRRTVGDTNLYASGYSAAGFSSPPHANRASDISTTSVAKNGWRFDKERWFAPGLLRSSETNTFVPPDWVYVYGQPKSNTTAADDKKSDIIGRYAAVVYDVGGLLDVNEAGGPSGVSLGDKGSVAFADLSAIDSTLAAELPAWRFAGSAADEATFYGNSTVTDPTKAGRLESPKAKVDAGENRFFSRMELVEAAKAGKFGLSEDLLPFLRTRSESANHLSVQDVFAEDPATTTTAIGLADDKLKASKDTTFTIDRIDGTQDTYTIKAGWPLIQNRFPLARLRWLADREADGTPKHPNEIKKYFGLTWNSSDKLFVYTSPDSSAAVDEIKTLVDLVNDINSENIPPREPDFFEWLKAGIDPRSLGQTGGSTWREFRGSPSQSVPWEISKDLHILRIGANIIDQSDPDGISTGIRSQFSGVDPAPFDSFGQENLPGINEVIVAVHRPNNNQLDGYFQFELWNPNRDAYASSRVPKGYDGLPISKIRVGTTAGTAFMQPYIYMGSKITFPKTPLSGNESSNSAWGDYKLINLYSKGEHPLLSNPLAPSLGAFHPRNLANQFVEIQLTGNRFFTEPAVASKNGPDFTTRVNNGYKAGNQSWLYLGATPSDLNNAIRFMTVDAPQAGISKVPLSCTTNPEDDPTAPPDGIYEYGAAGKLGKEGAMTAATTSESGDKYFNAVTLSSSTEIIKGVSTEPVTMQIEIQPAGSNEWIPVNRYHNLALGLGQNQTEEGRLRGIITGGVNGTDANETEWTSTWDATRDFSDWTQLGTRKGYLMCDPRTERFGLSDSNQASPGQGIYPLNRTTGAPFSDFSGNGITNNMPCGTIAAVGGNLDAGIWNAQGPAVTSPLVWHLFEPNIRMSPPAYLAWNEFNNNTQTGEDEDGNPIPATPANHAYKDYDGVARPGDARWVPRTIHPAIPAVTQTANANWYRNGTPNPDVLASRPTILDRPFRNVAELGCVFRDIPWKSLDLFSPDSADRRLLDIFSIEDRSTMTGKINPNLAASEVFQALLKGASLDPSSATPSLLSSGTALGPATMFSGLNPTSDPVHSSANMTARLSTDNASKPDGAATSDFKPYYKTQDESFIRALSSTTDTRSWQLMLDVVAQSGRVVPSSTNLQDFVVEGQRRFFVHLTLDRITGEVIDNYVEPVYE